MKKTLTPILIIIMSVPLFGQWRQSMNTAANPAHVLPYNAYDPWYDNFIAGYPEIKGEQLNFQTQQYVQVSTERYPKDANGNYIEMFEGKNNGPKLDTLGFHIADITYAGTNPSSYRLESFYNNNRTAIRNASATFNSNGFDIVNYVDSNFGSGVPPQSMARDSFVYNGSGELTTLFIMNDTGSGMYFTERHRFTWSGGKVDNHYLDDYNNSMWENDERVRLTYDANGNLDSVHEYTWVNSSWYLDEFKDYDHNASGDLTKWIQAEDDGSGNMELKEKWEISYGSNGKISEMEKFGHDGSMWNSEARRKAYYNTNDTLTKVEQIAKLGPNDVVLLRWIYGNQPPAVKPAAPSNLSSTLAMRAASDKVVNLSWTDNANNENGFKIERMKEGGSYAVVGVAAADATLYADTSSLEENTKYKYRVFATSLGAGDSDPSNEIEVEVPGNGPLSIADQTNEVFKAYPNPVSHHLNISAIHSLQIEMYDLIGNRLLTKTIESGQQKIDVSGFKVGVYLLRVTDEETKEIAVQRIQVR